MNNVSSVPSLYYLPSSAFSNNTVREIDTKRLQHLIQAKDVLGIISHEELFWELCLICNICTKDLRVEIKDNSVTVNPYSPINVIRSRNGTELLRSVFLEAIKKKEKFELVFVSESYQVYFFPSEALVSWSKLCEADQIPTEIKKDSLLKLAEILQLQLDFSETFTSLINSPFNIPVAVKVILCKLSWKEEYLPSFQIAPEPFLEKTMVVGDFYKDLEKQVFCDLLLNCSDQSLKAHKLIVGTHSHLLSEEFIDTIPLEKYSSTTIRAFLDFLYLGYQQFFDKSTKGPEFDVEALLDFAHRQKIPQLVIACTNLLCLIADPSQPEKILELAERYENSQLHKLYAHFVNGKSAVLGDTPLNDGSSPVPVEYDLSCLQQLIAIKDFVTIIHDRELFWQLCLISHICTSNFVVEKRHHSLTVVPYAHQNWIKNRASAEQFRAAFIKAFDRNEPVELIFILDTNVVYFFPNESLILEKKLKDSFPIDLSNIKQSLLKLADSLGLQLNIAEKDILVDQTMKMYNSKLAIIGKLSWKEKPSRTFHIVPEPPLKEVETPHAFYEALINQKFCDLTLKCKDKEIRAHKLVLGTVGGDVFSKMFHSPFLENRGSVIHLSEYSSSTVQAFLDFVYLGYQEFFDKASRDPEFDVLALLDFAHSHEIPQLVIACANLLCLFAKPKQAKEIFKLAELYENSQLSKLYARLTKDEGKTFIKV